MAFHRSSNFTVRESKITHVAGSQYNHFYGNLVQYLQPEKQASTTWDEYALIPRGKICIKETLDDASLRGYSPKIGKWRDMNTHRTINISRIHGEERDANFLHLVYTGPDALKAYKQDFENFSRVQDAKSVQLFGYNTHPEMPSLIFYDAHIPVSYILEQNAFAPLLQTYLQYLFGAAPVAKSSVPFRDLWVDPVSCLLHKGPHVKDSSTALYFAHGLEKDSHTLSDKTSFLPVQAYNDPTLILEYLIRVIPVQAIFQGLCWSNTLVWKSVSDEDATYALSSLPGTVHYKDSREVIARWPGFPERYQLWKEYSDIPEAMRDSAVIMADGTVQFMFAQMQDFPAWFNLVYDIFAHGNVLDMSYSWLSQAHCIFSQLGIDEEDWRECYVYGSFKLTFRLQQELNLREGILLDMPVYLFVRPTPQPVLDDENKWRAWTLRKKYYWSFDPSGVEEIAEDIELSLGLPFLICDITLGNCYWDRDTYDAIQMIHAYKGFDPKSTDLSRFLGFQLLEIHSRFEEEAECSFSENGGVTTMQIDEPLVVNVGNEAALSTMDEMVVD